VNNFSDAQRATQYSTPPMLAKRWKLNVSKILGWLRSGELVGFNVAARQGGRPRYRISEEAIRDFERRRSVIPQLPVARRRSKRRDDTIIQFF
jgi:hypothetical protein